MNRVITFDAYDGGVDCLLTDTPPKSAVIFQMLFESLYHSGGNIVPKGPGEMRVDRSDETRRRNASLQRRLKGLSIEWPERKPLVPDPKMARRLKDEGGTLMLSRLDYEHLQLCMKNSAWGTMVDEAYDDTMTFLHDAPEGPEA
jgi:hypothetical protein